IPVSFAVGDRHGVVSIYFDDAFMPTQEELSLDNIHPPGLSPNATKRCEMCLGHADTGIGNDWESENTAGEAYIEGGVKYCGCVSASVVESIGVDMLATVVMCYKTNAVCQSQPDISIVVNVCTEYGIILQAVIF